MNQSTDRPIRVLMLGAGLDVRGGITTVEKLILDHAPPELSIRHVGTFEHGSAIRNLLVFARACGWVLRAGLTREFDMLYIHFSDRGSTVRKVILCFLALITFQKYVLHFHGAAYQAFFDNLPKLIQATIAFFIGRCNKFIALSKSWRDYCAKIFHLDDDQVVIMMNPVVLPAELPLRHQRPASTFVFVGHIGKRGGALDNANSMGVTFPRQDKGAMDLIRAFGQLSDEERRESRLVLAGDGQIEEAQRLIDELGISSQAKIHPWVDEPTRNRLLSEADVFILPSYNEGLPMSMLEGMSWGLPPIVTPVGGIPEVIRNQENGILVDPGNQGQLTQAMQVMIRDPQLRLAVGRSARATMNEFDIHPYMKLLLRLFREVANNRD